MADIFKRASLKTLSSEVVKYKIYVLKNAENKPSRKELEAYQIKCLAHVTNLTKGYIWNNEGFNLCVRIEEQEQCLYGETDFGDFIEDEWLIVWLLYQITKAYPSLVCRVWDADGEFLLIEAADHLPKWLNIDTSKNRVFIHGGHLHIIGQPKNPGEIGKLPVGEPTLESALSSVLNFPNMSRAHHQIEAEISKRLCRFPDRAMECVQKVNLFVPELIVRILDQDTSLVSSAIRAFYYRDPIDLRACRVFKHFTPQTRVWSQISMNRCGYAQLMQQVFEPDRRSGYRIDKCAGADFKGMELGSKLAHGFEILFSNCKQNITQNGTDGFDETAFQMYVSSLHKRGYFDGEIEGSKRHKELTENARAYFSKFSSESMNNEDGLAKNVGKRISDIRRKISTAKPELIRLSCSKSRLELPEEDTDEWMYVTDKNMDELLSEMQKGFEKLGRENVEQNGGEEMELSDLGNKMQRFVHSLSGYDGVEYSDVDDLVNFDPSTFEATLLNLSTKGKLDAESNRDSLSDYFLSSKEDSDSDPEQDSFVDSGIVDAMQQMDDELASTNVGKSFIKEDSQEDGDFTQAVDIDLNLVQNFLESCDSEVDIPGAATTLLQSIGLGSKNLKS